MQIRNQHFDQLEGDNIASNETEINEFMRQLCNLITNVRYLPIDMIFAIYHQEPYIIVKNFS